MPHTQPAKAEGRSSSRGQLAARRRLVVPLSRRHRGDVVKGMFGGIVRGFGLERFGYVGVVVAAHVTQPCYSVLGCSAILSLTVHG